MLLTPTENPIGDVLVLPNIDRWIQLYLHNCEITLRRQETVRHYRNALKRFAAWYHERIDDGQIDRHKAKDFAYWLIQVKRKYDDHPGRPTEFTGLSPVTVRRSVGVVRTFLSWLHQEHFLPLDLSSWFPLPKISTPKNKTISSMTLQALLNQAAQSELPERDVTLIALLADTGLRRAEVVNLKLKQIHWLDKHGRGCLNEVEGKSKRLRLVPFSETVGILLKIYLSVRPEAADGELPSGEQALFLQENGHPLQPVSVYQILKRAAERAGVAEEVWNTHALRHTFATNHWRVMRDTKSLSVILGHSSQKITADIYVHPVPEDLMKAHTSLIDNGAVHIPKLTNKPARPDQETLRRAIQEDPNWCRLGQRFNLSDSGVRKLAKRFGLLDEYYQRRNTYPQR